MSANELTNKIKELRELRRMADELAGEIEAITDSIKAEMITREVDTLSGTDWKVSWKEVQSNRFNRTAFKATHAELYQQYTSVTVSKRFTVA